MKSLTMRSSYPCYAQMSAIAPFSSVHIIFNMIFRFVGKLRFIETVNEKGSVGVNI